MTDTCVPSTQPTRTFDRSHARRLTCNTAHACHCEKRRWYLLPFKFVYRPVDHLLIQCADDRIDNLMHGAANACSVDTKTVANGVVVATEESELWDIFLKDKVNRLT